MAMKFSLTKTIKAHGEEVDELEIMKPSSKDVRELGYPFTAQPSAGGDADIRLLPDIGAKYIARLCKIPMNSVDQLEPLDFMLIHTEICGFFGGAEPASSKSASSTSPGTGE
jgi:hypothetical protein